MESVQEDPESRGPKCGSKFAIAWKMPNGYYGQGQYVLTKPQAEAWIAYLVKKHPEVHHWIVHEE
jgi:hypothetical protein